MTRILIDMDNTIADFDSAIRNECQKRGVAYPDTRSDFEFSGDVDRVFRDIAIRPGFFLNLLPIPGAIKALREMDASGLDVWICTASLRNTIHCIPEKFQWIEKYLGIPWTRKIIVAKDKTMISADILVDDKIQTGCVSPPLWHQVCFAQPYNQDYPDRLLSWETWQQLV